MLGSDYKDFNLVLAQPGGRPYEPRQIDKMLATLIQENELRSVVFHSLRHSSTSIKLQINCGNIKAVQGDIRPRTGSHGNGSICAYEQRRAALLAQKVDENFFQTPTPGAFAPTSEMQKVLQILAEKPELVRLLAAM